MKYSLWIIILLLAACEQAATPFPVDVVLDTTPTAPPLTTAPAPVAIRYALDSNTTGYAPELENLPASIQLERLTTAMNPADLGLRYDLMAAYGLWPGATPSPVLSRVGLIINPIPPLNEPALVRVIEAALDMHTLNTELNLPGMEIAPLERQNTSLKETLANYGWPDGFDLTFAHELIPGYQQISQQLAAYNIVTRQIPTTDATDRAHLLLVSWQTPDERDQWAQHFGDQTVFLDLYSLPISYWAIDGLPVTFTAAGWPLPAPEN